MGGGNVVIEGSSSAWASVFNLGNCAIGAGVLSFPYAFRAAGLVGGLLLCCVVAMIEGSTLRIIANLASKYHSPTYPSLVRKVLGPSSSLFMSAVILVYLFGSCVAYMIIVGQSFRPLYKMLLPFMHSWSDEWVYRAVIMSIGLIVVLPLSMQRTMGTLAGVSSAAISVMVWTTIVIVGKAVVYMTSVREPLHAVKAFDWSPAALYAIPIMVFAFHCHVQSVPILYELTEAPTFLPYFTTTKAKEEDYESVGSQHRPSALRKLRGMYRVIALALMECGVMYVVVGVCGYIMFPDTVGSNVMEQFEDDQIVQVTRFLLGVAVMFHYPINQHVGRYALDDLVRAAMCLPHVDVPPRGREIFNTLLFFVGSTATALAVTDLGKVFQMIGGTAGSLMIFILPALMLLRHHAHPVAIDEDDADVNDMIDEETVRLRTSDILVGEVAASPATTSIATHAVAAVHAIPLRDYITAAVLLVFGATIFVISMLTTFFISGPKESRR